MGEGGSRNAFKIILTIKPTRKLLGRRTSRLEDNRIDLKEIVVSVRSWVGSAQGRDYRKALVNPVLKLRVSEAIKLLRACNTETIVPIKSPFYFTALVLCSGL